MQNRFVMKAALCAALMLSLNACENMNPWWQATKGVFADSYERYQRGSVQTIIVIERED